MDFIDFSEDSAPNVGNVVSIGGCGDDAITIKVLSKTQIPSGYRIGYKIVPKEDSQSTNPQT